MFHGLRVAVVVPAYNEEVKVGATVRGIPDWVDHVLVVDDASWDGTARSARLVARRGLEVIRHERNCGVGAAIATGYRRSLRLGCDVACVMAGDGQMDPRDLPQLIQPIADGQADYVKGNRFLRPEVWRVMPPSRLVGNIVLSVLTRISSGYWDLFDSQCGYTAASRRALLALDLDRVFPRYGYPNDLLARLNVAGLRVAEAPVRAIYGPGWRSGITLRTALYPVSWVLVRSLLWRLHRRYLCLRRPALGGPAVAAPQGELEEGAVLPEPAEGVPAELQPAGAGRAACTSA
ncbi:MAG: glycosyltransferase family 2 protein [Myxococcales bacterium]|nr:glycosyltransferase family 2 protein [Myxococcales bacterium]